MTDKEKIMDILLEFYEEYQGNIPNRPMIPSIYANKIIDSLQEEPVSEELEEEIRKYLLARKGYPHVMDETEEEMIKIARHFAKWQKQQMMKDAIEQDANSIWANPVNTLTRLGLDNFKGKVKLIIIKQEEE